MRELLLLRERSILLGESLCCNIFQLGANINPTVGCVERGEKEREEERNMQAKSADRTICFPKISRNTILWT
jgi:hypothetical protein